MASIFRRILVPHDFSAEATRALKVAAELAAARQGRLVVLHVIPPYDAVMPFPAMEAAVMPPVADLVGPALKQLRALVAKTLKGADAPPVSCRVVLGNASDSISEAARGCDSIVMTTTGRTGLAHFVIGSVAERVVRHSPVPVLTLRTRGTARRKKAR